MDTTNTLILAGGALLLLVWGAFQPRAGMVLGYAAIALCYVRAARARGLCPFAEASGTTSSAEEAMNRMGTPRKSSLSRSIGSCPAVFAA